MRKIIDKIENINNKKTHYYYYFIIFQQEKIDGFILC